MKKHTLWGLLFSLAAGIVAAIPLMVDTLPLLSFVAFIPYFLYLYTREETEGYRFRYYASGLFFFFGYYAGAFSFFIAMYPLDFAGLGKFGSIAVIFAAMILLPLFQAWFSAFAILILGVFRRRGFLRRPLFFALSLSALYTIFAFAQNFTWAGVPWANTAVGIASSPLLIQGASLLGSSFLVFFIIFVNAALAEGFIRFRECRDKEAILCFLAAIALFASQILIGSVRLLLPEKEGKTMTVAMLQGNAPSTEGVDLYDHLYTCRDLAVAAAEEEEIDLMLWSESVVTHDLRASKTLIAFFSNIAVRTGATQAVGAFSAEPTETGDEGFYNALFLFYPDGSMSEVTYKKQRPVPFGEYVPMAWLFETVLPSLTEISLLSRNTTAGSTPSLMTTDKGTLGGLICFDSIYPKLARESTKEGSELFLLSTDDSWFDGSFGKSLHFRHAVLRAVENGRTIVRTGNTGQSGIIDAKGNARDLLPLDTETYGIATVSLSEGKTLYTHIGDVTPYLSLGFLILVPLLSRKRKNETTKG